MKLPDVSEKMYYDLDILKQLGWTFMFWWRQSYRYRSNWRILHVDGMEGAIFYISRELPCKKGGQIQFFNYREMTANEPIV